MSSNKMFDIYYKYFLGNMYILYKQENPNIYIFLLQIRFYYIYAQTHNIKSKYIPFIIFFSLYIYVYKSRIIKLIINVINEDNESIYMLIYQCAIYKQVRLKIVLRIPYNAILGNLYIKNRYFLTYYFCIIVYIQYIDRIINYTYIHKFVTNYNNIKLSKCLYGKYLLSSFLTHYCICIYISFYFETRYKRIINITLLLYIFYAQFSI